MRGDSVGSITTGSREQITGEQRIRSRERIAGKPITTRIRRKKILRAAPHALCPKFAPVAQSDRATDFETDRAFFKNP